MSCTQLINLAAFKEDYFSQSEVSSRAGELESGHFWGFRSRSRQKLANSDFSKTLYCFFIKTIAGKVWFSSISCKFATEEEFIFNGKDPVCITRLPQQLDVRLLGSVSIVITYNTNN